MIDSWKFACLGAALARAGHEVRVFERLPGIVPGGTGILLEPAGLEVLRRMDLADAALALGSRITRVVARRADGTERMHLRYADLRSGLHALGIRRPALAALLQDAALAAHEGGDFIHRSPRHRRYCCNQVGHFTSAPIECSWRFASENRQ